MQLFPFALKSLKPPYGIYHLRVTELSLATCNYALGYVTECATGNEQI